MSKLKYVYIVCLNASTTYDMDDEIIKIRYGKIISVHTNREEAISKSRDYRLKHKPAGFVEVIQKRVHYDDN